MQPRQQTSVHSRPNKTIISAKSYKLFYLTDDHTNSVFEKVFICGNQVIKSIRYGLADHVKIYGIVGPVRNIVGHLRKYAQQSAGVDGVSIRFYGMYGEIQLEKIAEIDKPAVYLIKLQHKQKPATDTIFLALVSKNQLYTSKPFDQRSLVYLLLRFMGDLCDDIIIVYSAEVEQHFTATDCPYSSQNNRSFQIQIEQATRQNIEISKIQSCQRGDLMIENGYINTKIDWKHSFVLGSNFWLQFYEKDDDSTRETKKSQIKTRKQEYIWKQIMECGNLDMELELSPVKQNHKDKSEAISDRQSDDKMNQYQQALQTLKDIHLKTKREAQSLMSRCVRSIQQLIYTTSGAVSDEIVSDRIDRDLDEIYFKSIGGLEVQPTIKDGQFVFAQSEKVMEYLFRKCVEIVQSLHSNEKISQQQFDKIEQKILQEWQQTKSFLQSKVFCTFFKASNIILQMSHTFSLRHDKIQVIRYELIKSRKNQKVVKLQFKQQQKTIIFLSEIKKHIPRLTMEQITDVKVFKAKFLKQNKVLLISRKPKPEQSMQQFILMTMQKGEIKLIAKYKQEHLVFSFSEKNRKIYILKPSQKILTTFNLDDFQKSKNQKQFNLSTSRSNFQIVSYSISLNPKQKFYYLDSRKDTLYCYDISDKITREYYNDSNSAGNYLSPIRGDCYELVKCFNHNLYIILSNSELVDVYLVAINGQLQIKYTVQAKFNNNGVMDVFRGVSTHIDERNQYMVVYGAKSVQGYVFQNMSTDTFIRETQRQVSLGNPIIDIFYEANDRFGLYTTYTVCKNTPSVKKLNLHHIASNPQFQQKIKQYMGYSNIKNHISSIYADGQVNQIYNKFGLIVKLVDFINEAQSRIPVQICSVDTGNIIPLKDGNIVNNFDGLEAPIEQRCKYLSFGVVERLLKEDKNKKTIVVCIMGAQSTGKSYLLNRIFGTRFTVASCRTTIGIWMSLIKTKQINFILLDCEGLFSLHRQLNEQQKLIKILTSISDFSILNLNKSLANKSLTQLMIHLSTSVNVNQVRTYQRSNQLYNGKLAMAIRDVAPNQTPLIKQQLHDIFHSSKAIQDFIEALFGNNSQNEKKLFIQVFPTFTQTDSFTKMTQKMRENLIVKSLERPFRNSQTILNWLKIILNQLACDDIQLPQSVMQNRIIETIEEVANNAWRKGNEQQIFSSTIVGIKIEIEDTLIQVMYTYNALNYSSITKFFEILHNQVAPVLKIDSVNFSQVYTGLNKLIIEFFDQRLTYSEKILKEYVGRLQIDNDDFMIKVRQKQKSVLDEIKIQKDGLKLCTNRCADETCLQPCIKIFNHNIKIKQKIHDFDRKVTTKKQWLQQNKLTQEQITQRESGIQKQRESTNINITTIQKSLIKFDQKIKLANIIKHDQQHLCQLRRADNEMKDTLKNNVKYLNLYQDGLSKIIETLTWYMKLIEETSKSQQQEQDKQNVSNQLMQIKQLITNLQKQKLNLQDQQYYKLESQNIAKLLDLCSEITKKNSQVNQLDSKVAQDIKNKENKQSTIAKQKQQIQQLLTSYAIQQQIQKLTQNINLVSNQTDGLKKQQQFQTNSISKMIQKLKSARFSQNCIEEYFMPRVYELVKRRNQNIYNVEKQYMIANGEINKIYEKYKVEGETVNDKRNNLAKKLVLQKRRLQRDNIKNKIQLQKLREETFTIESLKVLQGQIQAYKNQQQKLIQSLFDDELSSNRFEQLRILIKFMCWPVESLNLTQKQLICYNKFSKGVTAPFFKYSPIMIWNKITKLFEEDEIKCLLDQVKNAQNFMKTIIEIDTKQKQQSLDKNQAEYAEVEQLICSMVDHEDIQNLQNKSTIIKSLIKLDSTLLKCDKYCKNDAVFYFQKCLNVILCMCKGFEEERYDQIAIKKCEYLEKAMKQLVDSNQGLSINVKNGSIVNVKGDFSQNLKQILQVLQFYSQQLQKQLHIQLSIETLINLYGQNVKKLKNLIKDERFSQYLLFLVETSNKFKVGHLKSKFMYHFLSKWVLFVEQNNENNLTNQQIFRKILIRSCLQTCNVVGNYELQKKQLEAQLIKCQQKAKNTSLKLETQLQKLSKMQKQLKQKQQKINKLQSITNNNNDSINKEQKKKNLLIKLNQIEIQSQIIENQINYFQQLRFTAEDFNKCAKSCSRDKIQTVVSEFIKEKDQNIEHARKIVEFSQKINQSESINAKNIQKMKSLELQTSTLDLDTLQKQYSALRQKLITLETLEKRIQQLNVRTQQLDKIEKQFQKLKQSNEAICSCKTNHRCDRKCEVGLQKNCQCSDKMCQQKSGHFGKHACGDHKCGQKCHIYQNCEIGCQKVFGHDGSQQHNCGSDHRCLHSCKYCTQKCTKLQFEPHQIHVCSKQFCPKKCIFCKKQCTSGLHNHDDQTEEITILIENPSTEKNEQQKIKLHLCGDSHSCGLFCTHPGVCENTYLEEQKFWQKNGVDTKYIYMKPIEVRKKCGKPIQKGKYKHQGDCFCNVNHFCSHRCPDCRSLCKMPYNHEGQHDTVHRNQEQLIYASEGDSNQAISVQSGENSHFIFNAGDISLPFKCNQSCKRKGRGHYHLIQCPGGDKCYEKTLGKQAKHSQKIYKPDLTKKYDMLLCNKYWELHNFKMPYEDKSLKLCNFACTMVQDHKDKNIIYCEYEAWHSMSTDRRQHKFSCDRSHRKLTINAIQICFLLDATGSAVTYRQIFKNTISRIIKNSSKNSLEQTVLKYGIVAYRDHPVRESPLFQKLKNLCINKKIQLRADNSNKALNETSNQLQLEKSLLQIQKKYDTYKHLPLNQFLQKFEEQSQKMILKYHYPFVLDHFNEPIRPNRKFIDQNRRKQTPITRLLKNTQMEDYKKQMKLSQLLQRQLNLFNKLIKDQQTDQILNYEKFKLLDVLQFTTKPDQCIRFQQRLPIGGGGDPPEAVLDGMHAASNLAWSQGDNTLRYIFHLFDAPPHGQQYDDNCEDYYPEGCPCKRNLDKIIEQIVRNKINYIAYPLTQRVNKTLNIFKSKGLNLQIKNINKAEEFVEHASALICRRIEQTEIMVKK